MTEQEKRMFVKQWQWRNNYYPKQQRRYRMVAGLLIVVTVTAVAYGMVAAAR